jgi:Uma2 family endonuclease
LYLVLYLWQGNAFLFDESGVSMTTVEKPSVVVPADWVPGPQQGQWTYKDYLAIPEDRCCYEVVNGVLYMSPSPGVEHQRIVKRLVALLSRFVEQDGLGEVFQSPLDVELSCRNVVQPDVFVILNEHFDRITDTCIIGAPDLVIEIASPSTARHDLSKRLDAYALAGVPEYWVITPGSKTVELLVLDSDSYRSLGLFSGNMTLPSRIVPNMPIKAEQFFAS